MPNGRRSRLIWPVTNRHGDTFYLSTGQRQLLTFIRSQARNGRHVHKIDHLAGVAGIHRSNVSRGLDRLAQLELVGRRSTRGPLGQTTVWVLRPHARRRACFRANVATTYIKDGYLTRERWESDVRRGEDRAVRRLTPPRVLFGRCAAGHRVRLIGFSRSRRPSTDPAIARVLEGVWSGRCRRDAEVVREAVRIAVPAAERGRWESVGEFLIKRGVDGSPESVRRFTGGLS